MAEYFGPESQDIGSMHDIIVTESMYAANEAFNSFARAQEIRNELEVTAQHEATTGHTMMIGPNVFIANTAMWRPVISWLKEKQADRLEAKARRLLPPDFDQT